MGIRAKSKFRNRATVQIPIKVIANAGTNQSLSFSYNYVYINLSKLFLVKTILESVDIHGLMTLFMLIIDYINYT